MSEVCGWVGSEQIYIDYHDTDWGVPEYDSRALWEKLILDGFQAGLSWITILKKRGFKFCGPTIVYAFMQAVGMVNDHVVTCPRHAAVKTLIRG